MLVLGIRTRPAIALATMAACLMFGAPGFEPARAGGIFLYEVGTPETFTGGAGWAARAQDAATVLTNPAGMTRLPGGDLLVGAGAFYGDLEFSEDENTTTAGGSGGVALGWLPNGGAYITHAISDQVWFGLATTSNFGLATSYDEGWVGRYYVEKSTLIGISMLPSLAWRVSPEFSLGASLNVMYGVLRDDVAINNPLPSDPDGRLSLSSDDLGFGGNFGFLWEASNRVRCGITYTSPVELDFADRPEFTDLGAGIELGLSAAGLLGSDLGLEITVPQTVMASFYFDLNSDWALMGDLGWQDWSAFGRVDVLVATDPPSSLVADVPFEDTWRTALGAKWKAADEWALSAGVGYDSAMVQDADRTLTLPVGDQLRLAAGAQHAIGERFELGFGYALLAMGDVPVDQERGGLSGRVSGVYENAAIHFLSLQGHWKF